MNALVSRSIFVLCCFAMGALSPPTSAVGQRSQEISPSWEQTLNSGKGQMGDCDSDRSWCVLDNDAVLDGITGLVWEQFPRSGASAPVFYDQTVARGASGFDDGSSVEYTPSTPEERTQFHVELDSDCFPATGSVHCPFPSIATALEEASAAGLIGIELYVGAGVYRDPLFITRDTVIRSTEALRRDVVIAATVKNRTPAYLELEEVTLSGGEPDGALNVSNDDATTVLMGVRIEYAQTFGITHCGGELSLIDVEISNTRTAAGFPWHGTGLTLTNGATAILYQVQIVDNASSGILVDGEGTYLGGYDVELRGNLVNRFHVPEDSSIPSFIGALNVRAGARARLQALRVEDNEFIGVFVEQGGQAFIEDAVIEGTYAISTTFSDHAGGHGVAAKSGGEVEIWDFGINDNDLAGIVICLESAVVALHDGEVIGNPIGVKIYVPAFDTDLLRDNVVWDNDDIDIDTEEIYVPTGNNPIDELI